MPVAAADGKLVPLSTFATIKKTTEPRESSVQQLNAVRIQGVVPPGVSLDKALTFLETEAERILPAGFSISWRTIPTTEDRGQQVPGDLPALRHS